MGALQGTTATRTSSSSTCGVLVKHFQISPLPPLSLFTQLTRLQKKFS